MSTRNVAMVALSFETLGRLMNLPKGQTVVRAEYDISRDGIRVLIEGEGLPGVPSGCHAMEIRPNERTVERTELDWTRG